MNVKPKKLGFMFSPFANHDTMLSSMGENLARAKKGKAMRPLILSDEEAVSDFEKVRQNYVSKWQPGIEMYQKLGLSEKSQLSQKEIGNFEDMGRRLQVLQGMNVIPNRRKQTQETELSKLSPDKSKLYVLGHGGVNMDLIASTIDGKQATRTSSQLAGDLSTLPKKYEDVRITSCWSANSAKPVSFSTSEKTRTSQATQWSVWSPLSSKTTKSFSQNLSEQMTELGFSKLQVTGYHGAGKTVPEGNEHQRTLPDSNTTVRRSTVAQKFGN